MAKRLKVPEPQEEDDRDNIVLIYLWRRSNGYHMFHSLDSWQPFQGMNRRTGQLAQRCRNGEDKRGPVVTLGATDE